MQEYKVRKRREELRLKNKKKMSIKDIISLVLIIFMLTTISLLSYFYYLTTPIEKNNNQKIQFEVKESYVLSSIADSLNEKKIIRSSIAFKLYSKLSSKNNFYAGNFEISKDMSVSEIINILTNKEKSNSGPSLSVIEGENIKSIALKVSKVTEISEEEFINKVNDREFINKLKTEFPNLITNDLDNKNIKYKLEGYLYPAKYIIDSKNKKDVELLLRQMIKITNDKVLPFFEKNSKEWNISGIANKITIHDYITMASILEKESTVEADNNSIAGVFINRLALNMPLQTDPTVYYSVDRQQSTGPLTVQELKNKNIYNTYVNYGLPPGPIASPSKKSYEALNNYTKHNYLYFLHAKDGKAYFSKTYKEHEELANKYIEGYNKNNR